MVILTTSKVIIKSRRYFHKAEWVHGFFGVGYDWVAADTDIKVHCVGAIHRRATTATTAFFGDCLALIYFIPNLYVDSRQVRVAGVEIIGVLNNYGAPKAAVRRTAIMLGGDDFAAIHRQNIGAS